MRDDRDRFTRRVEVVMESMNGGNDLLAEYSVVIAVPVQWGDQDAFQHVNNVVYFRWLESGRIAYFRRIGLIAERDDRQRGPILASTSCDFRRSVVFPDTVRVGIRATRIGRSSIALEHRIVSEEQKAIVAEGTSTAVFYDYTAGRSHPVSDDVRRAIEELEGRAL
jgi:acyl-CoA thioester hydrolase